MATFTWTPDFDLPKESEPAVYESRFGDGYAQRIPRGLNSNPKTYPLQFKNRSNTERDQIEAFLDARGGAEAFDWTPPWGIAGKFKCPKWTATYTNCNNNQITATFIQVFEF